VPVFTHTARTSLRPFWVFGHSHVAQTSWLIQWLECGSGAMPHTMQVVAHSRTRFQCVGPRLCTALFLPFCGCRVFCLWLWVGGWVVRVAGYFKLSWWFWLVDSQLVACIVACFLDPSNPALLARVLRHLAVAALRCHPSVTPYMLRVVQVAGYSPG
jgi:hypothetical protein